MSILLIGELQRRKNGKNEIEKKPCLENNSMSLRRMWARLKGKSSYKPPGASYTAQGPQKQPEILKPTFLILVNNLDFFDLDFCFQTFGAGSREENSPRIRI